jgi:hypothetical protein
VDPFELCSGCGCYVGPCNQLREFGFDDTADVPNAFGAVGVRFLDCEPAGPLGLELACGRFVIETAIVPEDG